ncbi:MAG TPA: nucleoside triphosphate pyrophosphohydrolase [Anaerolineales bacterium]
MSGITLMGLGPGSPDQVTREAWGVLASAEEVWLRTAQHPAVSGLLGRTVLHSFDDLYENGQSYDEVYGNIVQRVMELGRRDKGVLYAMPGHPFIAEATGPRILQTARDEGIPVRIIAGLSFIEPVFAALGLDPFPRLTLCDALTLGTHHVPLFPPDAPALVAQVYSRLVAAEVKSVLNAIYPDQHRVALVHAAGTPQQVVEDLALFEIDRSEKIGALTCLFVPPIGDGSSLEALQEVVAHLRAPEGCPWDREQTHASLRRHLLEEAYEAIEAMDSESPEAMREEFGDLLLQIMLNSQIAAEMGEFTVNDVSQGIREKIIRRHPHVFGDVQVDGVEGVLANWERLKEVERGAKAGAGGLLDGVPRSLPALGQAQEYQERAARVGFDWPEVQGVLDKIAEEIGEVRTATTPGALADELGDLFFALVNLSRWKEVDAESALRGANTRFKKRFGFIENSARQQARNLSDLSLEEMEVLWQQAKAADG